MHQWHITLAFGFALGYGARYLFERIRRAKARAQVYKGRWPVILVFVVSTLGEGCLPTPCPRVIRVITHRTYKVRRAPPKIEQAEIVRAPQDDRWADLERTSEDALEKLEELFPTVPDSTPAEVYVAPGCLR